MKPKQLLLAAGVMVTALSSLTAGPQPMLEETSATAGESDWSFRIAPYDWLQTVGGR